MLPSELQSKRVAIWGIGREGKAVLEYFHRHQLPQPTLLLDSTFDPLEVPSGIDNVLTNIELLKTFEVVIKSPGVSLYRPEITRAKESGTTFSSATNLALAELDLSKVIAVTGTKGKSTTASLITHFLRAAGKEVFLGGNIGVPLLESVNLTATPDFFVLELSSYQIADLQYFPETAVLTNLYQDHITWHGSLERYHADKLRLFGPSLRHRIIPAKCESLFTELASAGLCLFAHPKGFHLRENRAFFQDSEVLSFERFALAGDHNRENVLAALSVMKALEIDYAKAEDSLESFRPLPHRLTVLGERNGKSFVDDSISTVPETALAALKCFPGKKVTLLLGGLDRGQDWKSFASALRDHSPHAIITLPDNGQHIGKALREAGIGSELYESEDLDHAVPLAERITPANGVVLLSPAAASFPRFRNFEERGNRFAALAGFDPSEPAK